MKTRWEWAEASERTKWGKKYDRKKLKHLPRSYIFRFFNLMKCKQMSDKYFSLDYRLAVLWVLSIATSSTPPWRWCCASSFHAHNYFAQTVVQSRDKSECDVGNVLFVREEKCRMRLNFHCLSSLIERGMKKRFFQWIFSHRRLNCFTFAFTARRGGHVDLRRLKRRARRRRTCLNYNSLLFCAHTFSRFAIENATRLAFRYFSAGK